MRHPHAQAESLVRPLAWTAPPPSAEGVCRRSRGGLLPFGKGSMPFFLGGRQTGDDHSIVALRMGEISSRTGRMISRLVITGRDHDSRCPRNQIVRHDADDGALAPRSHRVAPKATPLPEGVGAESCLGNSKGRLPHFESSAAIPILDRETPQSRAGWDIVACGARKSRPSLGSPIVDVVQAAEHRRRDDAVPS